MRLVKATRTKADHGSSTTPDRLCPQCKKKTLFSRVTKLCQVSRYSYRVRVMECEGCSWQTEPRDFKKSNDTIRRQALELADYD